MEQEKIRILDEDGNELTNPDFTTGYVRNEQLFIKHHELVPGKPKVSHYEVVKEYEGGGRDVIEVIDDPGIPEIPAWDEYEHIYRYIKYTPEELEDRNKPTEMEILQSDVAYLAMKTGNIEVLKNVR